MGGELFYRGEGRWWIVPVETEPGFSYGLPSSVVFGDYVVLPNNERPNIDVAPNGQRFLMIKNVNESTLGAPGQTALVAVENWFEELERLAPTE